MPAGAVSWRTLYYRADGATPINAEAISLRCPSCGQNGTFAAAGQKMMFFPANVNACMYICPNKDCHGVVYVVADSSGILLSFPPELIDFDATNIPTEIREALQEAIQCHANDCFMAAAIMVRKTLEELCRERDAKGDNLRDRVRDLRSKVVIPTELLDGIDDLRLLGNDAAHIQSTVFDKIGREEVELGIEFAKEVLKAVYQYSDLLARLRAVKREES